MKPISHSRNSLYSLLAWLLPLGLTFFATPFIVRRLGNAEYGLYALVSGFVAYSFTFGVGRAVAKYVAEYDSTDEKEKISQVIASTFYLCAAIGTIGVIVICLAAHWLVVNALQVAPERQADVIFAFYLSTICIWFLMVGQVYSSVLQAIHRFDIYSLITFASNALLVAGNILIVWLGYGFVALIAWNAVLIAATTIFYYIYSKKLLPDITFRFNFDRATFWMCAGYGLNVTAYQIFGNILLQFERAWITRVLGEDNLTHYVVPMNIAIYIHAFIWSVTLNILPLTSNLFALGEKEKLKEIYRRATKIVFAIIVFFCVGQAISAESLLTNWFDAEFAKLSATVFVWQLITFGLIAATIISWLFIEGFGAPIYNVVNVFCWMSLGITGMIVLTESYGIEGAAVGRLLGLITVPAIILLIEKKIFGEIFWRFWLKILLISGSAAALAGTAEYFALRNLSVSWINLFTAGVIFAIVYGMTLMFAGYFNREEKDWLANFVKNKINRA